MAHLHAVRDRDDHFVINPTTRTLQTESKKITLMKTDHNSERFTFELPRKIEDHDMSECDRVEVHYINIDAATREKSTGVYEVTDFDVAEDNKEMVMGSWLISRNVTKYAGTLSFVIRFACTTGDVVDYSWSTGIYTGISISDGICNTEEVVAEYTDILQSWLNTLEEAASEVCMVTDEGTLVNLTDRLSSIEYSLNRQGSNQEVITQKVSALEQADTSLSSRIKTIEDSNPGRDTKITNLETKDTELTNAINANAEAINNKIAAIEENPIIIRFPDTFVEQAGETASLYAKAFSKFPKVGDIVIDQSGNMGEVEFIDDDYDYEETRLVEVRILRK